MSIRSLEAFSAGIRVLPADSGALLRSRFQDAFLDTTSEDYRWRVRELVRFSDGMYQQGYMRDCLKSRRKAHREEAERIILQAGEVLVLWDLHSTDWIRIPDYWKFGRDSVLACSPTHLLGGLKWLPEDLYVFDDTYTWALIFTHEYEDREGGQEQIIVIAPASYRGLPPHRSGS